MKSIRIHFGYRHVDAPWGGANNFIRALHAELARSGDYVFVDSMEAACDILFLNQLGMGPGGGGKRIPLSVIRRRREGGRSWVDRLLRRRLPLAGRVAVRAVNLYRHAFRMGPRNLVIGRSRDRELLRLLEFADVVIFQSAYQRRVFAEHGYRGKSDIVIHNGADLAFWVTDVTEAPAGDTLRIVSSTVSTRRTKRHDLIARLSELKGVEVLHVGNWPGDVPPRGVKLFGVMTRDRIVDLYRRCHFFFHPAIKDPCPNAVFEAICAGLPVIYHPGQGSSAEIVGPNGLALDEDDLAVTVEKARANIRALKTAVMENRAYYAVQRASAQYREVFDRLAREL